MAKAAGRDLFEYSPVEISAKPVGWRAAGFEVYFFRHIFYNYQLKKIVLIGIWIME